MICVKFTTKSEKFTPGYRNKRIYPKAFWFKTNFKTSIEV